MIKISLLKDPTSAKELESQPRPTAAQKSYFIQSKNYNGDIKILFYSRILITTL